MLKVLLKQRYFVFLQLHPCFVDDKDIELSICRQAAVLETPCRAFVFLLPLELL